MELARYDFKLPPLLTDEEVEEIISRVDDLVAWATDIKDYALQQAISGKEWNGWKLVEGRSNRKYTNETAVAVAVTDAGFDPYERKVLGVTAAEAARQIRFDELLAAYIEKPQGKPRSCRRAISGDELVKMILWRKTIMNNNTNKVNNPMKVITGPDTRWSYANVWEAKSINGGTPKFSG